LRKYLIGTAVLVTALITAAVALAVTQRTFKQSFSPTATGVSTKKPNKATGTFFTETSQDPANPNNQQPKQDAYTNDIFPAGAKIDQSTAPSCKKSDGDVLAGKCPAKSQVGSGTALVKLKQNVADISATITAYNCQKGCKPKAGSGIPNKNELILYVNPSGSNPIMLRGTIKQKNNVTTIHVPIPINCELQTSTPPNCGAAGDARISRFDLSVKKITKTVTKNGHKTTKAFLKTPKTCPASGLWTFTILFHGRDNVNQSNTSTAPCHK
jgi:hypothetical protein